MGQATRRWEGVERPYSEADVRRLQGSVVPNTLWPDAARRNCGSCCRRRSMCAALGALTGNQAVQQVKAGLKAIYLSGWQVAADANLAGHMYPDQSLYPANSVPAVVKRINQALQRADQIQHAEGKGDIDWFAPIVADAEAGFGGPLNVFELTKAMIEAGAAGVHFEDQLASEKKCGHMGGKVLIPTRAAIDQSRRGPTGGRCFRRSDHHHRAHRRERRRAVNQRYRRARPPISHRRTHGRGIFRVNAGLDQAIARGLSYAPFADLVWCETSEPNLKEAKRFAESSQKISQTTAGLQLFAVI